ncbi:pentatricopeptide repeat-containing protein At3g57430, chloroplastic-like [Tasmannia lanceolata]|uniref:pentatricopeptide repeat-containing protein At3g57430, chloroplastic-like n=1 Tax=Tasmannia lanceolata TaxID=3420 RepID=UPI0040641FA8
MQSKTIRSWQELKEGIAHIISNVCFSRKHLQRLHAYTISFGLHSNLYICTLLITKYSSFGDLETALRLFNDGNLEPSRKRTLVWNSLMRGYSRNQQPRSVLDLYNRMECVPDSHTFNLVITACSHLSEFELGSRVHSLARGRGLEFEVLTGTALITMYCQARDLITARGLFDGMPVRDVISWNAMIAGYSREGLLHEVLALFRNMRFVQGTTEATMVSVILACGHQNSLQDGVVIHAHAIKVGFGTTNQFVCNSLLQMYIKCRALNSALILFDAMILKDAVTWSTMMGGYVQNGQSTDTLNLFNRMILDTQILPTRPILLNVLLACADLGDMQVGEQIEEDYIKGSRNGFQSDARLNTVLIYMYTKCGKIETSLDLLERISPQTENVIAWNAMIKACAEVGQVDWASKLLVEMQRRDIHPNSITFLTLLPLFSSASILRKGMEAHACTIKRGFESEISVANSLIEMYGKCGRIQHSRDIFNGITNKDVVSWSLIIKSYAWNGNGMEALHLFQVMREEGMKPNHITFTAVLSACSHSGFVEKGRELFKCMKDEYELQPAMEHYGCMVDLFCRAGLLSEAYGLIENTIIDAHDSVGLWGTLLSACRIHGNWVIGEAAARHLFYLEPRNAANYMMLAYIYISAGRTECANGVLRLLREKGLRKSPGCSWHEEGNLIPASESIGMVSLY